LGAGGLGCHDRKGAVISPLLAKLPRHDVVDLWAERG
jgi:hypothetical protein